MSFGSWPFPLRMEWAAVRNVEMERLFRSNVLQDSNGVYENEACIMHGF